MSKVFAEELNESDSSRVSFERNLILNNISAGSFETVAKDFEFIMRSKRTA